MIPPIPKVEDYDVSPVHGFLPTEAPLQRLPDPYYFPWEATVGNLQGLLLSRRLRGVVDNLPILSTTNLNTLSEFRRAYSVLAFMTHGYIWGGDTPSKIVPPTITIPFLAVSESLGLPPVATYAAVCLWNYKPLFPDEPIDNLENLSTLMTFSGSLDESWFYLVSVAIEARGGPLISLMLDTIAAARSNNRKSVVRYLQIFAERIDELASLLLRMYDNCDPHVFYHRIRPFLAGSKNMSDAGLPNGVIYDDGSGNERYREYSGGSNAQSSLMQFFDVVLGIEHRQTGDRRSTGSGSESDDTYGRLPKHSFMQEMRAYMPLSHQRFLQSVESVANIRAFVDANSQYKDLTVAYDACLMMLRTFRDKHIQMVSRYIIIQSRESRAHSRSISPRAAPQVRNIASAGMEAGRNPNGRGRFRGTGGTALIPFLKQARDETGEPAVGKWATRLLKRSTDERVFGTVTKGEDEVEIVGLAATWKLDESEGGLCHW
ncbi:MAG: hypothetical protein M1814_002229 [Vezdaea aestivalis]|nr:MAG: hypothetical protein M1814_002229 [Vezdaea aestivalis]